MTRLIRCPMLLGGLAALCLLITASAQATHPRPKGATPLRMPLVPSYTACTASNRTHGPPLAFPSCNPPTQSSAQATVGTPDAFGGAASSTGQIRLRAVPGFDPPVPPDMGIQLALDDVRCVPTGSRCGSVNDSGPSDYSGEMRFSFTWRLTDHFNAVAPGGGPDPATVQDFATEFAWSCAESGSTSTGSTCTLSTSLNTLIPTTGGAVKDGKRGTWELDAVRIFDGGADGDGDTTADNTVFARPGVFVP